MKIRSITIGSFGAARNKEYCDISPGLNVIFGKNESGKTTLMEFIRSTLFPGKQRKTYPLRSRKDEGTVTIEMGDGSVSTVSRNGGGPVTGVAPVTYRGIFAMTAEDLRDSDIITSGDIRSRFLTVPGGKGLPDIIGSIEKEMSDHLTTDRRSDNTKIGKKLSEMRNIDDQLSCTRDDDRYSKLFSERCSIETEL
ncbi:MAG: AAA family ATPase, partial [Candidatus Methanoplasma sp.]|nr:AAA family ATPase [Candidatus Methanoplasma sp.]